MRAKIEYDKFGRMKYHPSFHPRKGKRLTEYEKAYLCKFYQFDDWETMAMALGKPQTALTMRIDDLQKKGKIGYYKRLWDQMVETGEVVS